MLGAHGNSTAAVTKIRPSAPAGARQAGRQADRWEPAPAPARSPWRGPDFDQGKRLDRISSGGDSAPVRHCGGLPNTLPELTPPAPARAGAGVVHTDRPTALPACRGGTWKICRRCCRWWRLVDVDVDVASWRPARFLPPRGVTVGAFRPASVRRAHHHHQQRAACVRSWSCGCGCGCGLSVGTGAAVGAPPTETHRAGRIAVAPTANCVHVGRER